MVKQAGIKTWNVKTGGRGNKGEYEWSGEISRIIPLGNNYCYVQDEKGKLHHIKRDSPEFYALAKHLNEIMSGKITNELQKLGWTEQLEVLS